MLSADLLRVHAAQKVSWAHQALPCCSFRILYKIGSSDAMKAGADVQLPIDHKEYPAILTTYAPEPLILS